MPLFLITLTVFVLVILMMAIGVLLGNRRIQGSCGGPDGCDFCLFKGSKKCVHKHNCKTEPCTTPPSHPPIVPTQSNPGGPTHHR